MDLLAEDIPYRVMGMTGEEIHLVVDYPNLHSLSKEGVATIEVGVINNKFLVTVSYTHLTLPTIYSV